MSENHNPAPTLELPAADDAPEAATETLEATPVPATAPAAAEQAPGPLDDLAAEIAARLAEVDQEQAARKAAHAQADLAFGIELDADIAAKRKSGSPAYADAWKERVFTYCDEASDIIAAKCSPPKAGTGVAA